MNDILTYLNKLDKEVFTSHHKWTKGTMYRDNKGKPSEYENSSRMCLVGGIYSLTNLYTNCSELNDNIIQILSNYIRKESSYYYIVEFNDDPKTKFSDVKKLIKRVIKEVKNNENK